MPERMTDKHFDERFSPRMLINKGVVSWLLLEAKRAREAEKVLTERIVKLEDENVSLMALSKLDTADYINSKFKAENKRLKDWEKTIIQAPGPARDIAIQRFRDSDFVKEIIAQWKKENAELKKQLASIYCPHCTTE